MTTQLLVSKIKTITQPSKCKVIMITIPTINKKSRSTKEPTPAHLIGLSKVTIGDFGIGYNYESVVKNSITASGGNPDDFQVAPAKGRVKVPDCPNSILEMSPDGTKFYAQLFYKVGKMQSNPKVFYINSNYEIIEPTQQEFEDYFKLPTKELPAKQIDAGMDEDRATMPFTVSLENLVYLQKGTLIYDNMSNQLKKLIEGL